MHGLQEIGQTLPLSVRKSNLKAVGIFSQPTSLCRPFCYLGRTVYEKEERRSAVRFLFMFLPRKASSVGPHRNVERLKLHTDELVSSLQRFFRPRRASRKKSHGPRSHGDGRGSIAVVPGRECILCWLENLPSGDSALHVNPISRPTPRRGRKSTTELKSPVTRSSRGVLLHFAFSEVKLAIGRKKTPHLLCSLPTLSSGFKASSSDGKRRAARGRRT